MAEVKVKVQPPDADPVEIENRIIVLCHQFPHGITDQVIQNEMPHIEAQQRAVAINRLLSMGQSDLLRSNTGLLYRIKDSQNAGKMKGSDNQEKLVYQIIEDAGNKGIWSTDIRYKSNLPLTEINKILKNLESKNTQLLVSLSEFKPHTAYRGLLKKKKKKKKKRTTISESLNPTFYIVPEVRFLNTA
uniref:DNA-directed RNA polymerase III subunit RPC6 n=1 Tax=Suricata suricatta TaxID=37032 RepID=A0A673VD65_SURSU